MSYAVGSIVYGVNLKEPEFHQPTHALNAFIEDIHYISETDLVHTEYNGSGNSPCYVGVKLGTLNPADDVEVSKLALEPSAQQRQEMVRQLVRLVKDPDISEEFRQYLSNVVPTVFITWGSS